MNLQLKLLTIGKMLKFPLPFHLIASLVFFLLTLTISSAIGWLAAMAKTLETNPSLSSIHRHAPNGLTLSLRPLTHADARRRAGAPRDAIYRLDLISAAGIILDTEKKLLAVPMAVGARIRDRRRRPAWACR